MIFNVAGVTFRELKLDLSVGDEVEFVHDPKNKHSKSGCAINVMLGDVLLGFVPEAMKDRKKLIGRKGVIEKFSHTRGVNEFEQREFNDEGEGYIGSVQIKYSLGYMKDGKEYQRITQFLQDTKIR